MDCGAFYWLPALPPRPSADLHRPSVVAGLVADVRRRRFLNPIPRRSITADGFQATAGSFVVAYPCSNQVAAQSYTLNAAGQIEVGGPSTGLCLSSTGSTSATYPVR